MPSWRDREAQIAYINARKPLLDLAIEYALCGSMSPEYYYEWNIRWGIDVNTELLLDLEHDKPDALHNCPEHEPTRENIRKNLVGPGVRDSITVQQLRTDYALEVLKEFPEMKADWEDNRITGLEHGKMLIIYTRKTHDEMVEQSASDAENGIPGPLQQQHRIYRAFKYLMEERPDMSHMKEAWEDPYFTGLKCGKMLLMFARHLLFTMTPSGPNRDRLIEEKKRNLRARLRLRFVPPNW